MVRIRDSYPDWHTRDNETGADQLMSGERLSGLIFEDSEILYEFKWGFVALVEGLIRWIPYRALVNSECTAREVGDVGDISILERFAIENGWV